MAKKPDKFDPYREALVQETSTVWPDELAAIAESERARLAERLHADAEHVAQIAYVRLHTGFCRQITVTAEDVERVKGA